MGEGAGTGGGEVRLSDFFNNLLGTFLGVPGINRRSRDLIFKTFYHATYGIDNACSIAARAVYFL